MSKSRGNKRRYRGKLYKSDLELETAKDLYRQKRNKKLKFRFDYEPERLDYILYKSYLPDFRIKKEDGSTLYIEVKGRFDDVDRAKMLACRDQHPDKTFVLLFSKNNPVRKRAKKRYSDWCEQHGFDYAFNSIPERWLK